MQQTIIKSLAFPKALIAENINLDLCAHGGYFNPDNSECGECHRQGECHWIFQNEEDSALKGKSMSELISALEYSISFVDLRVSREGHNYKNCQCDSCQWLREAYKLFSKALLTYES